MNLLKALFVNFLPIILMILLIPLVKNDFVLLGIYIAVTVFVLILGHDKKDIRAFFLGLVILTISESIFVSTGVESFSRKSLFGIMPIWLPVLWGYSFIGIKRTLPEV